MSVLRIPGFGAEYIADFLDLFGRVVEEDGTLVCTRKCIGMFVRKHSLLVELVTGMRVSIDWNEEDEDEDGGEIIPHRDRMQEFRGVYSAALVCYERIMQTAERQA